MKKVATDKRNRRRYNVPVIGHFANRSVRFNSILEAEYYTGISYTLIFEACVGKIYKARNVYWEFENGAHYLKYKSHYLRAKLQLQEEEDSGESRKKVRKRLSKA